MKNVPLAILILAVVYHFCKKKRQEKFIFRQNGGGFAPGRFPLLVQALCRYFTTTVTRPEKIPGEATANPGNSTCVRDVEEEGLSNLGACTFVFYNLELRRLNQLHDICAGLRSRDGLRQRLGFEHLEIRLHGDVTAGSQ